jgi:hypothetical protein
MLRRRTLHVHTVLRWILRWISRWFKGRQISSLSQGGTMILNVSWEDAMHMSSTCSLLLGINTYCYAFLNLETRKAYTMMFSFLFQVLSDASRKQVKFAHIHGDGICTITVDMCKTQAPGNNDTCLLYVLHMLTSFRIWRVPTLD